MNRPPPGDTATRLGETRDREATREREAPVPTRTVFIALGAAVAFALLLGATYAFFPRVAIAPAASPAATPGDLVAQGQQLFVQFRCGACHTIDGGRAAGPTLKGLAGSTVTLTTGQRVLADSAYLRESIVDPDAKVPQGYAPQVMGPAVNDFMPRIMADHNLDALVAYIESLK